MITLPRRPCHRGVPGCRPMSHSSHAHTRLGTAGTRTRGSAGEALTNSVMVGALVSPRLRGVAVRPVAIIPDVLEVRGQLTQNEVDLRQLIIALASVALSVRQPLSILSRHLIGGERVYGLAGQQAAEQFDPLGRRQQAWASAWPIASSASRRGPQPSRGPRAQSRRTPDAWPARSALRSTSTLRLPIFATLAPLPCVQSSGWNSLR